jgi:hypothetical protein
MPALVAGIHAFLANKQGVDGRDKSGHAASKLSPARDEWVKGSSRRLGRVSQGATCVERSTNPCNDIHRVVGSFE